MDYANMTITELKHELKTYGLKISGNRPDLELRLTEYFAELEEEHAHLKVCVKLWNKNINMIKTYTVYTDPTDTILELKQKIEIVTGVEVESQRLKYTTHGSKQHKYDIVYSDGSVDRYLENEKSLADYNVINDTLFDLSRIMMGRLD